MRALVAGYARSPFHFAGRGRLATIRPEALGAQVARGLIDRLKLDPKLVRNVILGCAAPEGMQGGNLARVVGLLAGLLLEATGLTVSCSLGSSMHAIHIAAAQIEAGFGNAFLCVGVESMTTVPAGGFHPMPNPDLIRHTDLYMTPGESAEIVSKLWRLTRKEQDAFSVGSHRKASRARSMGLLAEEIVGVSLASGELVDQDGCIRPDVSMDSLGALRSRYRAGGTVTVGTSSPFADGASAVLLVDEAFAERHGVKPLARIAACGSSGVDPALMGIAPVSAARQALARAGIGSAELEVVELSETFSSHVLACMRELELDEHRVNIDGGALALGLPLGAAGAHVAGKAASLLARTGGRYALAAQPVAGGLGIATVLERV